MAKGLSFLMQFSAFAFTFDRIFTLPLKLIILLAQVVVMTLTCLQVLIAQDENQMITITDWQYKELEDSEWKNCILPSSIYTILENQGLIEDAYRPGQEEKLTWVDQKTWMFRSFFKPDSAWLTGEKTELIISGLDVFADVQINGTSLVKTDNAFRTWILPVDHLLNPDSNEIIIVFSPTTPECNQRFKQLPAPLPGEERVTARTAQFRFGWDFAPRFTGCAIRQLPQIRHAKTVILENFRIHTNQILEDQAELELILNARSILPDSCTVDLLIGQDSLRFTIQTDTNLREFRTSFSLQNPKLWWPAGQGDQHLYDCTLVIHDGSGSKRIQKNGKFGIRTIRLAQDPDEYGSGFQFMVNERPVFMKGSNLVPSDALMLYARDPDSYILSLKESNFNMVRIWGGGTYESDAFYQACDKYGILVWQDFMFACGMYPGDEEFLENVRQEAIEQVTRLSGHACIALWCGNNENHEGWERWGWQLTLTPKSRKRIWADYEKLFLELLPGLVLKLGNQCSYVHSSPKFGRGDPRFRKEGDAHDWGIWHDGLPFKEFRSRVPRFLSEAGFQSIPSLDLLGKYISKENLNIDSDALKTRQKHRKGFGIMSDYMARDLPQPSDLESWSYLSQVNQAEGMALGIRAHRFSKPYCMGTLYWQLNDCWPGISWSGMEYGGRWKALHHKVRHLYQPVLCSVEFEENQLELFIVSDLANSDSVEVKLSIIDAEGRPHYHWVSRALISPDAPVRLLAMDISEIIQATDIRGIFALVEWNYESVSDYQLTALVPLKSVLFKKPNISIQDIRQIQDGYQFLLSSDQIAKSVLVQEKDDWRVYPNFVDLIPGKPILVRLSTSQANLTTEEIQIRSLFDFQNLNK